MPKSYETLEKVLATGLGIIASPSAPDHWRTTHRAGQLEVVDATRMEAAAAALVRLPARNEQFHFVTGSSFSCAELLARLVELIAGPIAEARVATLGFNEANLQMLRRYLAAEKIGNIRVLASSYFRASDADRWTLGQETAQRQPRFALRSARVHLKAILCASKRGRYTILSSANLRSCLSQEFFLITAAPALFQFYADWFDATWQTADP